MANNSSLQSETLEEIGNELRRQVMPEVNRWVTDFANSIMSNVQPPVHLILGKTIDQAQDSISQFKFETARAIDTEIRKELAQILNHSVDMTNKIADVVNDIISDPSENIEKVKELEIIETEDEMLRDESDEWDEKLNADDYGHETQATPAPSNGMSISAIRSVIKERIDNETIEDILKLHHTGMTTDEIRASGITMTEQTIEVIINDFALDTKPSPTAYSQKIKDDIRSMYANGHTIEYIAAHTRISMQKIDAMIQGIDQIRPNATTIALIKAHNDDGKSSDQIAELCSIKPEIVEHSLNGSQ